MAWKALWCAVALFASPSVVGCGDDDDVAGDGDADADADGDGDADVPVCDDGIQNGDEEDIDCGGSCDACLMEVESTDPEAGATDVPLDREIRVVFSREIDAALPARS